MKKITDFLTKKAKGVGLDEGNPNLTPPDKPNSRKKQKLWIETDEEKRNWRKI